MWYVVGGGGGLVVAGEAAVVHIGFDIYTVILYESAPHVQATHVSDLILL